MKDFDPEDKAIQYANTPWTAYGFSVVGNNYVMMATVSGTQGSEPKHVVSDLAATKLMAAAPELLTSLWEMLSLCGVSEFDTGTCECSHFTQPNGCEHTRAYAAIRKALRGAS